MSSTVEEATTGLERMEQAVRAARDARAALEKDLESVKAEIQALTALQARIQASLDATLAFTSSGPSQPTTAGPEETEPTKAVAQEDTPPESTTPQDTPTDIGTPSHETTPVDASLDTSTQPGRAGHSHIEGVGSPDTHSGGRQADNKDASTNTPDAGPDLTPWEDEAYLSDYGQNDQVERTQWPSSLKTADEIFDTSNQDLPEDSTAVSKESQGEKVPTNTTSKPSDTSRGRKARTGTQKKPATHKTSTKKKSEPLPIGDGIGDNFTIDFGVPL